MTAPRFPDAVHNLWTARFTHLDVDPVEVTMAVIASDAHPAGTLVDLPPVGPSLTRDDLRLAQLRFVPSTKVIRWVRVAEVLAPGAPPLVYTDALDTGGRFPAATLVAFERPPEPDERWADVPDGALLDGTTFARLGLAASDQVGAVQWWPHNGQIVQLYVAPSQRRRKLGSKIVAAAELVSRSRGGQPVRGGGERTALGDAFTSAAPDYWTHRVAELTVVRPPMTPPADAVGVPERNLEVRP